MPLAKITPRILLVSPIIIVLLEHFAGLKSSSFIKITKNFKKKSSLHAKTKTKFPP